MAESTKGTIVIHSSIVRGRRFRWRVARCALQIKASKKSSLRIFKRSMLSLVVEKYCTSKQTAQKSATNGSRHCFQQPLTTTPHPRAHAMQVAAQQCQPAQEHLLQVLGQESKLQFPRTHLQKTRKPAAPAWSAPAAPAASRHLEGQLLLAQRRAEKEANLLKHSKRAESQKQFAPHRLRYEKLQV